MLTLFAGEIRQQQWIPLLGGEADRVRVDDFFVDDGFGTPVVLAGAADDRAGPVNRPCHVVCSHVDTVMKFDALAQLEFLGRVIDHRPLLRQRRFHVTIGLHRDQYFEHVIQHSRGRKVVVKVVVKVGVEVRVHRLGR